MESYIDYNFYTEVFGGNLSAKDFSLYEFKARKFIDKITFNRINSSNITNDIKMALCIAIENIKENDKAPLGISSESVGKHSISYSEDMRKDFERILYKELSLYIPANLLFRGVD